MSSSGREAAGGGQPTGGPSSSASDPGRVVRELDVYVMNGTLDPFEKVGPRPTLRHSPRHCCRQRRASLRPNKAVLSSISLA